MYGNRSAPRGMEGRDRMAAGPQTAGWLSTKKTEFLIETTRDAKTVAATRDLPPAVPTRLPDWLSGAGAAASGSSSTPYGP